MQRKRKRKKPFPRLTWARSPVQRAHSTPKGRKDYNRRRLKDIDRREGE